MMLETQHRHPPQTVVESGQQHLLQELLLCVPEKEVKEQGPQQDGSRQDGSRQDGSQQDGSRQDGSRQDGVQSQYLSLQCQPRRTQRFARAHVGWVCVVCVCVCGQAVCTCSLWLQRTRTPFVPALKGAPPST
ncbi:MAG: hypothetical protein EOP52_14260 [Sphingobacteriales bacterium]|nr:MAG: hypothetical protein EOP52_14260 [Sphingobacteriales bacterium]